MNSLDYVFTDDGVTIVGDNGEVIVLSRTSPMYLTVVESLKEKNFLSVRKALNLKVAFERHTEGAVDVDEFGNVRYNGRLLRNKISDAIAKMVSNGENFKPLMLFLQKAHCCAKQEQVDQIFDFVDQLGFYITENGNILGYKYVHVKEDGSLTDCWTKKLNYNVGETPYMNRDSVCADRNMACAAGLHVGTWEYVSQMGNLVAVEVNPMDVVSVPLDTSCRKMRTCRFTVIQEIKNEYEENVYCVEKGSLVPVMGGGRGKAEQGLLDNACGEHWTR